MATAASAVCQPSAMPHTVGWHQSLLKKHIIRRPYCTQCSAVTGCQWGTSLQAQKCGEHQNTEQGKLAYRHICYTAAAAAAAASI